MQTIARPQAIWRILSAALMACLFLVGSGFAGAQAQEGGSSIERLWGDLFGDGASENRGDAVRGGSTEPGDRTDAPLRGVESRSDEQLPESVEEIRLTFAPLVRATAPSVVNVYAERVVRQRSPFGNDPFFERFFGQSMPNRTQRQSSLGSGVVVDPSGIVVTNGHVIEGADDIRVAFSDGREYSSEVILRDETIDLAVLKIESDEGFDAIPIADSDDIEVGDLVLAIGNPFGVGQTVTSGIISALARNQVGVSDFGFFIQTDAAINPGNSGGPLIDMSGRLIGINTAIYSRSGGSNGIGFAIPANMVRAVAAAAETGSSRFVRPYIGATFQPVTPDIAEALGITATTGAFVSDVAEGGPADLAGLRPGDIVRAVNGRAVEHPDALGYRLATAGIGSTANMAVYSQGDERTVSIALEAPPEIQEFMIGGRSPLSGAIVADLTPAVAQRLDISGSVEGIAIVDIEEGSPAQRYGLLPGDVLLEINGQTISSTDNLDSVLSSGSGFWRFEIDRQGRRLSQIVR